MTLVLGNAGPAAYLVSAPISFPGLPLLGPHSEPFCSEPGKFQQSLRGLVRACLGSHLCPILVHLGRPRQTRLLLNPSWEFSKLTGNSAAPLPRDSAAGIPPPLGHLSPGSLLDSPPHILIPMCSFPPCRAETHAS